MVLVTAVKINIVSIVVSIALATTTTEAMFGTDRDDVPTALFRAVGSLLFRINQVTALIIKQVKVRKPITDNINLALNYNTSESPFFAILSGSELAFAPTSSSASSSSKMLSHRKSSTTLDSSLSTPAFFKSLRLM